jgi:hypothetical protein
MPMLDALRLSDVHRRLRDLAAAIGGLPRMMSLK